MFWQQSSRQTDGSLKLLGIKLIYFGIMFEPARVHMARPVGKGVFVWGGVLMRVSGCDYIFPICFP